jgi:multidrug efflux system outer membrane protein
MFRSLAILSFACACLVGCSMAPRYHRPEAPVAANWPSGSAYKEGEATPADKPAADIPWQEFFADEKLKGLIALALENNRDLRVAALNIERARAQYRIQRADLFPFVDAAGGYSKQRVPDAFGFGKALTLEQYDVNLGISSWEIDFFGRVRSLKEQALEAFFATDEARRAAQISLVAEVARGYLLLAADRELLELASQTLKSYQATYDLTRQRFDAGVASSLDVRQAQTSVESARVDIARFTGLVAEDENALRVLIGTSLSTELLPETLGAVTALEEIPAGIPSAVLQRRPDILAAEHRLIGANASIGAARAAFFPRISLTAAAGFASEGLSNLFDSASKAWLFAPAVDLPIFNAGSLRARLKTSRIDREIALARYEGAIQRAFREVADALAERGTIDDQLTAQQSLVDATAESYRLAQARYQGGVTSYLNVLDSQRAFYAAQQGLIGVNLTRLSNQVTLYKALGGGSE